MLCQRQGLDKEADDALAQVDDMYQTILNAGWDGEWFVRAYDAYENKVGSHECEDGKIFIEPQGFCVLAGVGIKEGHANKALASVEKILDTKYGIVLLLTRIIILNLVRFPLIRQDIRKMLVSSATTILGSLSLRHALVMETARLMYTARSARRILKTSVRSIAPNLMYILR